MLHVCSLVYKSLKKENSQVRCVIHIYKCVISIDVLNKKNLCNIAFQKELIIIPEHISSPLVFSGIRVADLSFLCSVNRSLFVLFFCPFSFDHCIFCPYSIEDFGFTPFGFFKYIQYKK